jgi:hypothetical protein
MRVVNVAVELGDTGQATKLGRAVTRDLLPLFPMRP